MTTNDTISPVIEDLSWLNEFAENELHRAPVAANPFPDLEHYRTKLARVAEMDAERLRQNDRDTIAGLCAGRWAITLLLQAGATEPDVKYRRDVVMDSMSLWLKANADMETALKLCMGNGGSLAKHARVVLEENLERGAALLRKLQDLLDSAIHDGNLPAAREISSFSLNLYVQTRKTHMFLIQGAPDGRSSKKLWEAYRPVTGKGSPRPKIGKTSAARNAGPAADRAAASAVSEKPATPLSRPTFMTAEQIRREERRWLAWTLFVAAVMLLVGAGILYRVSRGDQGRRMPLFVPEDFALILPLQEMDVRKTTFFGKVDNTWLEWDRAKKVRAVGRLRDVLKCYGITSGILTGLNDARLADWSTGNVTLNDIPGQGRRAAPAGRAGPLTGLE